MWFPAHHQKEPQRCSTRFLSCSNATRRSDIRGTLASDRCLTGFPACSAIRNIADTTTSMTAAMTTIEIDTTGRAPTMTIAIGTPMTGTGAGMTMTIDPGMATTGMSDDGTMTTSRIAGATTMIGPGTRTTA